MKTTSSCVLNSTAILDAIRSRECEILFEFQVKSRLVALPEKWNCGSKHVHLSDGMRRPVSTGCDKLPMIDVLKAQRKGDRQCRSQTFGRMVRSRIAMETGTHSPWVSRLLTGLGHEVIVAHAQRVRLIVKSRRKDDRLDARTLARLARIDPELLSPVQHRSAEAQIHLTEIRARAGLVSARTA